MDFSGHIGRGEAGPNRASGRSDGLAGFAGCEDGRLAQIRVHGPLKRLAGDRSEHELAGATVGVLLRELEREHPALAGWVLDERGRVRPHINVFVNGEQAGESASVGSADRVELLPAISGG
jgi:molybdopterin synthase sulfur carrier subunit